MPWALYTVRNLNVPLNDIVAPWNRRGYIGERRTWSWSTRAFPQLRTTNSFDHILLPLNEWISIFFARHNFETSWVRNVYIPFRIDRQFQFSSHSMSSPSLRGMILFPGLKVSCYRNLSKDFWLWFKIVNFPVTGSTSRSWVMRSLVLVCSVTEGG